MNDDMQSTNQNVAPCSVLQNARRIPKINMSMQHLRTSTHRALNEISFFNDDDDGNAFAIFAHHDRAISALSAPYHMEIYKIRAAHKDSASFKNSWHVIQGVSSS